MNVIDYDYIARIIANLSGIPTRIFDGEELQYNHSVIRLPKDPMNVYRCEIFAVCEHVGYFITPMFHVYGIVNSGSIKFVIGPTAQILATDQSLRKLAFQADVSPEETQAFVSGMKGIIRMPLENLLTMLCSVNYMMNGEKLELKDIAIHSEEQEILKKHIEQKRTEKVYDTAPATALHNTLQLEETLMDIVRKGNSAALRQWIEAAPPVRAGILASNQLRQLKNTFIVTATLTCRAAIRGGMDAEDAFSLSDAYIQRAELSTAQSTILNLQYNMVLEYTEQVEKIRRGQNPSKLAVDVANYVQHHMSEPIRTEAIAKEFFLTRTHFSAKFKQETGMTLTEFILKEKTEEAKRLLRYSDKSLSSIGVYLGFSSYGHFARVFKKYAGITPKEYREKQLY